ncbi:MAG: nucleotidyl transferase AbiEii/AbiGii toxin family protein, partial [Candidatus Aenigmatarchaeota archaeon]
MIDRKELRNLHGTQLPLHILEQDYIQALFLSELYKESESLVFKGGTFLKHAYGLDRFSEDMDFTATDMNFVEVLQTSTDNLGDYGVEAELIEYKDTEASFQGKLRYRGPLYSGSDKSIGRVEIEISKRDDVFLSPKWTRLFFLYPETRVV